MKHSWKKWSLIALLVSTATSALAGGPDSSDHQSMYGISVTGLMLAPGASNLDYAVYTEPLPLTTPNWSQRLVKPNYAPAFAVGLQYIFPSHIDEIKLDWTYLKTSNTSSAGASGTASIAPTYYFGPGAQGLAGTSASSTAKFTVSDVNLIYDHAFTVNHYLHISPFVGFNTGYLKQYIASDYTGTDRNSGNPYNIKSYNTSKYWGVGPRLGVDFNAMFGSHFGVLAEMGASLLVGSMDSTTTFNSFGGTVNLTPVDTTLANITQLRVVPKIDSKLAFQYHQTLSSDMSLNFEAGYLFGIYVNGINQVVPTALVPNAFNNGTIAIETDEQEQVNLMLNGPYIKLSWLF